MAKETGNRWSPRTRFSSNGVANTDDSGQITARENNFSFAPHTQSLARSSQMPKRSEVLEMFPARRCQPCAPLHFLASIRRGSWLTDTGTLHPTSRQCLVADQ